MLTLVKHFEHIALNVYISNLEHIALICKLAYFQALPLKFSLMSGLVLIQLLLLVLYVNFIIKCEKTVSVHNNKRFFISFLVKTVLISFL